MKRLLSALFLLAIATPLTPLFANNYPGDDTYIPDQQELLREGYGPRTVIRADIFSPTIGLVAVPRPTQAYYGKGYTVYYGYSAVPVPIGNANVLYAFGYPADYFRKMMPLSLTQTNLDRYATVVLDTRNSSYAPGSLSAPTRRTRAEATSTVQSTTTVAPATGTAPSPAAGEKPAH